jgi:GH25 family lysozyme M1 (1,4-beta-N-acetylmuramidase)
MAQICPTCGGTRVGCPTCGLPPQTKAPKAGPLDGLYGAVFGTVYWEVQGIDISKWNGNMSFSVTKTKCQYGFMRLGYGTQWKDANSDVFYRDAMAADFPMGVYWYLNIGQDANLTAESFASEITTHRPQLDIVLDVEATTLNPTDTLNWLMTVDAKLTALTGKKAMIYTSAGFWEKVAPSSYWTGRELWVANWTTRDTPYLPSGWSSWKHWQWSADGNRKAAEYGSTNGDYDMDLDRFNGTVLQFNAKYGTHITQIGGVPTPVPPGTVPEKILVNTGEANFRSAPNPVDATNVCGSSKMGMVLYPEAVEKDQFGKEWYKLGKKIYIKKELTRLP